MALRFIESFDHYATADITKKWTIAGGLSISAGNGRNSTASGRISGSSACVKTLDSQATWVVGFAWRSTTGTSQVLCQLRDQGTAQVDCRTTAGNVLTVTRNGTLLATGTTVLAANTWYYVECKFTVNNTTGVVKMRINGIDESFTFVTGTETTQDTQFTANASANQVAIQNSNGDTDYDDLYVCDSSGPPNNDYLGDCRVEALLPSGVGTYAQFNRSAGSDNYANVDDAAADNDTTYNYETTSGDIDSFAMGNLAMTSGTIYGVQTNVWARKDDAGSRTLKPHFRIASTDYARTTVGLSDSYLDYRAIEETNPNTAAAWDVSGVNGAEFGYKIP